MPPAPLTTSLAAGPELDSHQLSSALNVALAISASVLPLAGVASVLPLKRLNWIVQVGARVTMAPPALLAVPAATAVMLLPVKLFPVIVALPAAMARAPPPSPVPVVTLLFVNVLPVRVS